MSIEGAKAFNLAFGYNFPKEMYDPNLSTCKQVTELNNAKALMYVPILKYFLVRKIARGSISEMDPVKKAFFARAVIAMASSLLLIIFDVFATIFIKPFIQIAVGCQPALDSTEDSIQETNEIQAQASFLEAMDYHDSDRLL